MTSSLTWEYNELELQCPENGKLLLRKTKSFDDGVYIVDIHVKNFPNITNASTMKTTQTEDTQEHSIEFRLANLETQMSLVVDILTEMKDNWTTLL